jgi:hypothetical protein
MVLNIPLPFEVDDGIHAGLGKYHDVSGRR